MKKSIMSIFLFLSIKAMAGGGNLDAMECRSTEYPEMFGSILTLNAVGYDGARIEVLDHPDRAVFNTNENYMVSQSTDEFQNTIYYLRATGGMIAPGGYRLDTYYEISELTDHSLKLGIIQRDYQENTKTTRYVNYTCIKK